MKKKEASFDFDKEFKEIFNSSILIEMFRKKNKNETVNIIHFIL